MSAIAHARNQVHPYILAVMAGLGAPATALAQFSWTPQTTSPEWNATRTVQIGQDLFCLNNWNNGMVQQPGCPAFPDAGTNATFDPGAIAFIASSATCRQLATAPGVSLTLQGGTLRCASTALESPFLWSGGAIVGSPAFTVDAPGMQIFGVGDKVIGSSTILNNGVIAWEGGNVIVVDAAVIDNRGALNAATDNNLQFGGGALPIFENNGAVSKVGGTGVTTIALPFHNDASGQVRVFSGTIRFTSSLTSDAGSFTTIAGTTIELANSTTLRTGTTLTGPGLFRQSGFMTVTDLVLVDNIEFLSGGIAVTPTGEFRIIFAMNWLGGTIGPGGGLVEIIAPASMTLSGGGDKGLGAATLQNDGDIQWTGGNWVVTDGGVLRNRAIMNLASGNTLQFGGGALPLFDNTGIVTKTAGTTSVFNLPVNQAGVFHAMNGNITMNSSVVSSSSWMVEDARVVTFNNSTSLNAGSTLRGEGLYRNTGTVNVTDVVPVDHFDFQSGNVRGAGTLRIDDSMTWESGTIGFGGGTVLVPSGSTLTMQSPSDKGLSGFALTVEGETTWDGGNIIVTDGGVLNNFGDWTCRSDNVLQFGGGGLPQVNNSGLFHKTGGTGVTGLNLPFLNTGAVRAEVGVIRVGGPLTNNAMMQADAGTEIRYDGSVTLNSGAELRGDGAHRMVSSTFRVNGVARADRFVYDAGTLFPSANSTFIVERAFNWSTGTLAGMNATSTLELAPTCIAEIGSISGKGISAATLRNRGEAAWSAGNISLGDGAVFSNEGVLRCTGNNSLAFAGGAIPRLDNSGTIEKTVGIGTTTFGLPFNNAGTVRASSGVIQFNGVYSQSAGAMTLAGGGFSAGPTMSFTGGVINGSGNIAANVTSAGAAVDAGAVVGNVGVISITGTYTQSGSGVLDVDVVSADANGADRLTMGGIAMLGGTLRVRAASGLSIPSGTTWTILSSPDRRGTFASTVLPAGYSVEYTPTTVVLRYSCPADFNHDGIANSQDFFDYITAFVSNSPTADFNADGFVTSQDFFEFLNVFFGMC